MLFTQLLSLAAIAAAAPSMIHKAPSSTLQARDSDAHTEITFSSDYTDYGCKANVWSMLIEAIKDKCKDSANACASTESYNTTVEWVWAEADEAPSDRDVAFTVDGQYPNKDTLFAMRSAMIEALHKDMLQWEDREYTQSGDGGATHAGGISIGNGGEVRVPYNLSFVSSWLKVLLFADLSVSLFVVRHVRDGQVLQFHRRQVRPLRHGWLHHVSRRKDHD
jgi:hypothetical protein